MLLLKATQISRHKWQKIYNIQSSDCYLEIKLSFSGQKAISINKTGTVETISSLDRKRKKQKDIY